MNPENIMLTQISQTQKDKCCVTRLGKFRETESRMEVTRGWGQEGMGRLVFNDYRLSVWDDGNVLVMVTPHCECT